MLSKKKTRPITVLGDLYRWAISPDSGFVTFVAEAGDDPGRRIEVYITDIWVKIPDISHLTIKIIKPKDAAAMITQALAQGWSPHEKGKPLVFDYNTNGDIKLR